MKTQKNPQARIARGFSNLLSDGLFGGGSFLARLRALFAAFSAFFAALCALFAAFSAFLAALCAFFAAFCTFLAALCTFLAALALFAGFGAFAGFAGTLFTGTPGCNDFNGSGIIGGFVIRISGRATCSHECNDCDQG
jgi:hypothetical protein